jgi:RHS repeat-associated protein
MLKKLIYTTAALAGITCAHAQVAPPPAYPSVITAPVNYIRTWDAVAPVATEADLLSRPARDVKQATQYLDGLGRPLQTVMKQGSLATGSAAADLVSPVVYDGLGREQYKYLPFVANSTGGNASIADGLFKRNPFQQQAAFETAQYPGEQFFYSKTNFEASPLSKPTDAYAPGNSWAGSEGNIDPAQRHNTAGDEFANTTTDDVWIWTVQHGAPGTLSSYSSSGSYPAGQLMKTISKDEQDKQVIEYKDKSGQVILKKVQLTAAADDGTGNGNDGWLCTYYLYDDFGRLCCVVQPKAVEDLPANGRSLTPAMLDEFCFRYEYDGRGRMIIKKVPGAGMVQMVYDGLDRLVLTQDANMAAAATKKWMYTIYDALSRPVSTGLWATALTRTDLQIAAYSSTTYPVVSGAAFEELTQTRYGDQTPATPRLAYDDASFAAAGNSYPYPQPLLQTYAVRNMVTETFVKQLNNPSGGGVNSINYYDEMGRPFASYAFNEVRDLDITTTQYSYSGQLLQSVHRVERITPADQKYIVQTRMSYDDLGRPVQTEKKVTGITSAGTVTRDWAVIASNEYDALGQMKKKILAPYFNGGLETENYEYNIRGWLLGMNRDYAKDAAPATGSGAPYFGFDLGYDKTANGLIGNQSYTAAQYNGNIAGMVWKSKGDGEKRKYDFSYDAVNRLLKADFTQYSSGSFNTSAGVDFSMKMGDGITPASAYDANGNIKAMTQSGLKINASSYIDQLTYTYDNSNKLKAVTDAVNDNSSKLGDFKYDAATKTLTDYTYDANGNMVTDANKKITGIQYNHLNLPQLITIPGKGTIAYTYDAGGNKLKKLTTDNSVAGKTITTTTTYLFGYIFETKHTTPADANSPDHDEVLQYTGHEEGRIRLSSVVGGLSSFAFDYMLKDHLGNVRAVITDEQKENIYPGASMEVAQTTTEEQVYAGLPETRSAMPTGYPTTDYTTSPNERVAEVGGPNKPKMGPSLTLKVMAGDKFTINVSSWYRTGGVPVQNDVTSPASVIAAGLLNGLTGSGTVNTHGVSSQDLSGSGLPGTGADAFLNGGNHPNIADRPKAFLNWILLDEQFKYVSGGAEPVRAEADYNNGAIPNNNVYPHVQQDLPIGKNGFLYIFVSNESTNIPVYFDNLRVKHTKGALLEETHYYPFGLRMDGISSKAAGGVENKLKYNGKELQSAEFSDGSGLELYDYDARMQNPQLGRWFNIDPLAYKMPNWSPYCYTFDNPINFVDKDGREPGNPDPPTKTTVLQKMKVVYKQWTKTIEVADKALVGVEASLRLKAAKLRSDGKEVHDIMHPPVEGGGSTGGGGASGSWEYNPGITPKKSKDDRPKSEWERFTEKMDKKSDALYDQANKAEENANAVAGARDALGNFTIEGLAKNQGKDFITDVYKEVSDRYNKSSEADKKNFNEFEQTKDVLSEKYQKIIKSIKSNL